MLQLVTRIRRVRRIPLLAAAAAATALAAGCGTAAAPPAGSAAATATRIAHSPAPASASAVPTTTAGPPVVAGQPACAGWPGNVSRYQPLPASFVPVAVLRCVAGFQTIPGKGQWETATLERADQNLAPLIAALRRPSQQRAPGMLCPDIAMVPPQFVVLGGDGTAIWPRPPLTACGVVQPGVLGALSALHWQEVSVRLLVQTQTQQQLASGCAPQYSDPFAMYGSLRPSPGGAVFPALPASLRICVYSAGAAGGAPRFARSATVAGATERDLLAGLAGAGRSALCTLPDPGFAIVGGPGAPQVYVELGGCHRVLRYDSQAGGLAGMSTGQATPGAVAAIESASGGAP